jgi:hypothetical protein
MGNESTAALVLPEKANFDFMNLIFAIHLTHTGHRATNRKVSDSIPDGAIGIFQ